FLSILRPFSLLLLCCFYCLLSMFFFFFFFCTSTAPPEIYTLSYTTLFRSRRPCRSGYGSGRPRRARPGPGASLRVRRPAGPRRSDRKSTRLNSSHVAISYAVFCLKKKKKQNARESHKKHKTNTDRQSQTL